MTEEPAGDVVIGMDVGGTSTRALAVGTDGSVVGRGSAGGGSIRSSAANVAERLAAALRPAVPDRAAGRVRGGVVGIAGGGPAGAETVRAAAAHAWQWAGLAGAPRVVTDLEVAFAAGTPEPDGLLLLAGTGAGAAAFAGRRMVRRSDGYGWLLGDDGSAVWLGLRAARAALAAHDGRGPATALRELIAQQYRLAAARDFAQQLIARVHAHAPARLGELAPLVTRAAAEGDEVAAGIVAAAVERLLGTLAAVRRDEHVLVLAGALLLVDGALRSGVIAALPAGLSVHDAGPGAAGAAVLALADLTGAPPSPDLHAAVIARASGAERSAHDPTDRPR